jgi:hypothetical protein
MKIIKYINLIVASIFLTACNHSTVSTDSSQNSGFKGEFSLANSDSQSVGKTQRATSKQQLLTALVIAAKKTNDNINENYFLRLSDDEVKKHKAGVDMSKSIALRQSEWERNGKQFDSTVFADDTGMLEFAKTMKLPDQIDDWFLPLDAKAKKYIADGNVEEGRNFLLRYWCISMFLYAVNPSAGWPRIGGLSAEESRDLFVSVSTRRLQFANLFASEIARMLPTHYKNPADLRSDFIVALNKIPNSALYAIFSQSNTEAESDLKSHITIDGSSGKGTSWVAGSRQYDGQNSGWAVKTGGQQTFGAGYIDGQLYELDVSSSLEVTSKMERSNRASGNTGSDESSKGSVTVK